MIDWEKKFKECRSDWERDMLTNYYLSCMDPYYTDKRPNKMKRLEYPYFTPKMTSRMLSKEIVESSVNTKGTLELKAKGMAENKEL